MKDLAEMEWNYRSIICLIKEYEKRPELWNPKHENYRNPPVKHDAWTSLAEVFNADLVDIRRKMNSLFASYRREKSRIRNGCRSKWFLYKHLKFLPSYTDNGATPSHNSDDQNQDFEYENVETLEDNSRREEEEAPEEQNAEDANIPEVEYFELTTDTTSEVDIKEEQPEPVIIYPQKTQKRIPRRILPNTIHIKKKLLRRTVPEIRTIPRVKPDLLKTDYVRNKDDCDSFGEYIADSLRKHDERTKSMIKHAINNIIFEQEMKKYSNHYEIAHEIENPLVLQDNSN